MAKNNPEVLLRNIGRRVAELRRARGWTQERFAEKLDVTVRHIQSVEAGRENMSIRTLAWIADVLSVDVRVLLWKPRQARPKRVAPAKRPSR